MESEFLWYLTFCPGAGLPLSNGQKRPHRFRWQVTFSVGIISPSVLEPTDWYVDLCLSAYPSVLLSLHTSRYSLLIIYTLLVLTCTGNRSCLTGHLIALQRHGHVLDTFDRTFWQGQGYQGYLVITPSCICVGVQACQVQD